ncbi:unnamed protein product [Ceutorhynchus assimilis]|uniref:Uncharacterized protein n=1 Tax=Ceutorhynchus assimilis TaxID=467358 RepID=A0A9N9MNC7_9CUCU|nr:unnamed protein product [Ceutorhynchus assimilis]
MSENKNSPIPDDKMMAYLYDDVDDADIFGFGDTGEEEGTRTNDDYGDTPDNNRLDFKSLEIINENQILKETIQRLRLQNDTLDQRISEVYKTAKREIERKDKRIQELQDETNNILFRRNYNRFSGQIKPQKFFTNEDFQQFRTDYKIPKKNADCSNESEQKWSKSNVLDDRDSLSPPRQKKTVQENENHQDKSGKYPTNPSKNKRYQDRGSPPRFKADNIDNQDDPKLPYTRRSRSNTPSRRNRTSAEVRHRSSSRSPRRYKNYQDRSRTRKISARSPSRNKSRSKSAAGNRVAADPRDIDKKRVYPNTPSTKNRSSSKSPDRGPDRQKNNQSPKITTRSPMRQKSRSTSIENSTEAAQKVTNREREPNSPSKEHRLSSRSPQRYKNYQDRSRKRKMSARSPSRNKSRSKSAGYRVEADTRDNDKKRVYPNTPSRKKSIITGTEHRSSSRSPDRQLNNQSPKITTRSPLRQKSRSTSVENSTEAAHKKTNRERECNSPLKQHRSSSRSPQRHKNYQDRSRKRKISAKSPLRNKSRSKSAGNIVEADPRDIDKKRMYHNTPSRKNSIVTGTEQRSSSRSPHRQKNNQSPSQPKTTRSPLRQKSRSTSVEKRTEAARKVTNRERQRYSPLKEHRSSRSPQRHEKYQDRPSKPKPPRRSPMRHKSRSVEADQKATKRGRERSNSPSREHGSSSRSSQRYRNCQERPRQPKPPPGSPRRKKSRSASAENQGDACKREEHQEKHNRFESPSTRKPVVVDQYKQKRPPRTPPGSPSSTKRRRTPSPRRNTDKRRQSRPSERATRGRSIERRLGWRGRRGIYRGLHNDSVSLRRPTDYRRRSDYRKRNIEQFRRKIKQHIIESNLETSKFDKQERDNSGDEDICKMTDEDILRRLQEKRKELNGIEEGGLRDDDKNINLLKNAKNNEKCKKFDKSKKETYKDLLKETQNIKKQAQKDMLGIKKPEINPNVETKLLETLKSPDAEDPRLNPRSGGSKSEINPNVETKLLEILKSPDAEDPRLNPNSCGSKTEINPNVETKLLETLKSPDAEDPRLNPSFCDSKSEKPRARINFEAYKKRREAEGRADLARIVIYQEIDIENHKISKDSNTIIAEIQNRDSEEDPSDNNDHEPEEKEVETLMESDYKYTPAVDDEDAKLDLPEEKNSSSSFLDDFNISEDDDRFGRSDCSIGESKKKQAQKDIEINAFKMHSKLETKALEIKKSLDTDDMNSNAIVKNSRPETTDVSINFETFNQHKGVSYLASVESKPEVDITDKKMSEEHCKDKTSEKSDRDEIVSLPIIDVKKCEVKIPKVNILSNVVITAGSSPQTSTKSTTVESSVESIESIQKAVLNSAIQNKALEILEIKDNIDKKLDQNKKELINQLFGEMTPSPRKPSPEPKVKKTSRQVEQAKRQLKLQVDPVKTIKKSPRSRKKVELKQLLMQSEIIENEEVETRTIATKLEDLQPRLQHNNPSFFPSLPGDNKAFDTPNTYIKKKNEQKRKPAAKNNKKTEKPKVEAKKRGVFRIKLQTSRKKKKIQNYETSSSELSSDSYSDCQSPEPENNKKSKMETKKRVTRKSKTAQEKIEEVAKKKTTNNNAKSDVIGNQELDSNIKIEPEKITDADKSEDIQYTETKTNKRSKAKSVKVDDNVITEGKCDITKDKSDDKVELIPSIRNRSKSVKLCNNVRFEAKVTDISDDKSKNIENNQVQRNRFGVKLLKAADNVIAEEKCKEDEKCDSSENSEVNTNKRDQTVITEETKINKRNRAKLVKVFKTMEKSPDNNKDIPINQTIANKKIQAKPVEVSDITKIDEKITDRNEDKSENSKNTKTNADKKRSAKAAKVEVIKFEEKTENLQNTETNTKFQAKADNTPKIEEKISDFSEFSFSKTTTRRRINPTKVGEVTPSNKRKLDTQEETIPNKLPKLEQSPLPHMESMLKQLESKSSPQTLEPRDCSNKITAVNVENGVVEININSKDVSLGPMDNLFMLEDFSNYLNVSDRKTEASFPNFQLKNTSTPNKQPEKKEENAGNSVENEIKEHKVSPIISGSPKEYLKAPLKRDRTRRIRVGLVHLSS